MWELQDLCFLEGKTSISLTFLFLSIRAMRTYSERKRHNDVAIGLSFVAVALLVLGFMGMAQHLEIMSL